ncbi:hypothetical protein ACO0LB_20230 [Undibacterium sp. SXout7W]|uniref:hypothetical protein n=1 Tax=Undibacterium sp. SXout7W TaxID=3413049 RepID=UPI003BF459A4
MKHISSNDSLLNIRKESQSFSDNRNKNRRSSDNLIVPNKLHTYIEDKNLFIPSSEFTTSSMYSMAEGILIGICVGGLIGAIAFLLRSIYQPFLVPLLQLVITSPFDHILSGALTGIFIGSISGGLLGYMVSSTKVKDFEENINKKSSSDFIKNHEKNNLDDIQKWKRERGEYIKI